MKRLIRDKRSKRFFRGGGQWTDDNQLAKNFRSSGLAVMACRENGLSGVEVVLQVGDRPSQYDVVLPVMDVEGERQEA